MNCPPNIFENNKKSNIGTCNPTADPCLNIWLLHALRDKSDIQMAKTTRQEMSMTYMI